jgi:hypothetical protein
MKLVACAIAMAALCGQSVDPIQSPAKVAPPANIPTDTLLISDRSVEALFGAATFSVEPGRNLTLEPGVRFNRGQGAYSLTTYDGAPMELEMGPDKMFLSSPVSVRLTDGGWEFNGGNLRTGVGFTARRRQQDDADSNLKSMQEAAKKLKSKTQDNSSAAKLRVRWLHQENPFVQSEIFNSAAILQLSHISPLGF